MAQGSGHPSEKTRHIPEILLQLPKDVPPLFIPKANQQSCESLESRFISACKAADERLSELKEKYKDLQLFGEEAMITTHEQFVQRSIVISFFGAQNSGKSTLLNALLGGKFLPVKDISETGVKVRIEHCKTCHDAFHHADEQQNSCKNCPQLLECKGEIELCRHKGVANIRARLQELNGKIRSGEDKVTDCVLQVNVPVLSGGNHGYRISLLDNPGFGETNEYITQLADTSAKSSSVYVYVTESANVASITDFKFFENLAQRCPDAFLNHRLLVAVTKFDQKYGTASMLGDVATEGEVRSKVCGCIEKAAHGCIEKATRFQGRFQLPQVIMLSGLWALQSKELLSPTCDRQLRQAAAFQLSTWPGLNGGQEENELLNLLKLGEEVLAKKLERASGITDLEQRIKDATSSCIKIWVTTVGDAYCKYLGETLAALVKQLDTVEEKMKEKKADYEEFSHRYEDIKRQWKEVENTNSVLKEIEDAYPEDVKLSKSKELGRDMSLKLVDDFEEKCRKKINTSSLEFGPKEFDEDFKTFLKHAQQELQRVFNTACGFSNAQEVVYRQKAAMRTKVNVLRMHAHSLCYGQGKLPDSHIAACIDLTETNDGQSLPTPNLGHLLDKILIPSVKLSFFEEIYLWFSNLLSKAIGSRHSEQTDRSQSAEADNQPNAGVEQNSSRPNAGVEQNSSQPASESNTVIEEQRSSQLEEPASQPNAGVEQSSSQLEGAHNGTVASVEPGSNQLEGAHNGTVASVEQSSSEKEKYRCWNQHLSHCMKQLRETLRNKCDQYFDEIQPLAVKYFFMDYHDETRERLKRFSDQFGALLGMEEQRQAEVSTTVKELEGEHEKLIEEIDEICKLEMHLKEQVGSYLSSL